MLAIKQCYASQRIVSKQKFLIGKHVLTKSGLPSDAYPAYPQSDLLVIPTCICMNERDKSKLIHA